MTKKTRIKVSFPFILMLALMYVLDCRNLFLPTLLAVALHELSHIAAIRICGGSIDEIDIRAFGIRARVPELNYMPYEKEIIIAAAGPIAGVITASSAYAAANLLHTAAFDYFIGVNIVITVINLIPVYPLDGGRIILSLALKFLPVRVAYTVSYIFAVVSISALFSLCLALALNSALNPSLVVFTGYIAFCGIKFQPRI